MSGRHTPGPNESCPSCGSALSLTYGPDYRFDPPCSNPRMWTARCGGECFDLSMTWTSSTRDGALGMWNRGVRAAIAKATGSAS